jgi:hypothetical protein
VWVRSLPRVPARRRRRRRRHRRHDRRRGRRRRVLLRGRSSQSIRTRTITAASARGRRRPSPPSTDRTECPPVPGGFVASRSIRRSVSMPCSGSHHRRGQELAGERPQRSALALEAVARHPDQEVAPVVGEADRHVQPAVDRLRSVALAMGGFLPHPVSRTRHPAGDRAAGTRAVAAVRCPKGQRRARATPGRHRRISALGIWASFASSTWLARRSAS